MKTRIFTFVVICIISLIISGCHARKSGSMFQKSHQMIENALSMFDHPIGKYDSSKVSPLSIPKKSPVTQNLIVIFDHSLSMNKPYVGLAKSQHAKLILKGFNNALPDIPLKTMFYKISSCSSMGTQPVQVLLPLTTHDRFEVRNAIDENKFIPEKSPLAKSLNQCKLDLSSVNDNIAVVIITDGNTFDTSPIEAAKSLYHEFGARIGIYPIMIGNSPHGKRLLQQIADQSVCGFVQRSDCLLNTDCMHNFIYKIIYDPPYKNRDRDNDGIKDQMDLCPRTPKGNVVDSSGCSPDTDGDSISDDRDKCPDTPPGTIVESNGCPPKDRDNDGVLDKEDQCLDTPAGAIVDAKGCTKPDQDQDGVLDIKDDCIDTPIGASVNSRGCWVISDLQFAPGKWELESAHKASLQEVLDIMKQNPDLRIEIQGHTDNTGPEGLNLKLSSYRAMSVMKFLMKNGIRASRLTFMGYGSEKPIVSNDTPTNRALNRRVEFNPR
jgi:OOP family OmpA-OmpF porin